MDKIGIIGLGYVGLPLAAEFGKVMDVVGFDINKERIAELKKGFDRTREVEAVELKVSTKLTYSSDIADQPGLKWQEIPFRARSLENFVRVYADAVKDQSQLVHKSDIDIAL